MNENTRKIIESEVFKDNLKKINPQSMPFRMQTPPQMLERLGAVIVLFQALESAVKTFIQVLVDVDSRVLDIITVNSSFRSLSATLDALAKEKNIVEYDLLKSLLISVRQAEELRNGLVHSQWLGNIRLKVTLKPEKGLSSYHEEYSVADLLAITEFVHNLVSCVYVVLYNYLRRCKREGRCPKCAQVG